MTFSLNRSIRYYLILDFIVFIFIYVFYFLFPIEGLYVKAAIISVLVLLFLKRSELLFFSLVFLYFLQYSFHNNVFGIYFDPHTSYLLLYNLSNIVFIALTITITLDTGILVRSFKFNFLLMLSLGLFIVSQIIATLYSHNFLISYEQISRLFYFIIFIWMLIKISKKTNLISICNSLCAAGIISGTLYLWNIFVIGDMTYNDDGNIIYLLPFVINNGLYRLITNTGKKSGYFLLSIGVLIFISLIVLDIRRFFIAFIIILMFLSYKLRKKVRLYIGIICFCIVGVLYNTDFDNIRIFKSINYMQTIFTGDYNKLSTEEVYTLWTNRNIFNQLGIDFFNENPFFGVGPGLTVYRLAEAIGIRGKYRIHNLYLELLNDSGILGLLLYLFILIAFISTLFSIRRSNILGRLICKYSLIDIFLISTIINFFGARGPYDKYEWFFYGLVMLIYDRSITQKNVTQNI